MEGLTALVKYVYSAFILRDFLGKIVPGSLVLMSTYWSATSLAELKTGLSSLTWMQVTLLGGASWTAGFAAQTLGAWLGISAADARPSVQPRSAWLWPKAAEIDETSLEFRLAERNVLTVALSDDSKALRERQTVIVEATGNMASSMLWSGALVGCHYGLEKLQAENIVSINGMYVTIASLALMFVMLCNRSLYQQRRKAMVVHAMSKHAATVPGIISTGHSSGPQSPSPSSTKP